MKPLETRLSESICPSCQHVLDAATESAGRGDKPRPSDFSVCAYCGDILTFNDDLSLRTPTVAELVALPDDLSQHLKKLQILIRRYRPGERPK